MAGLRLERNIKHEVKIISVRALKQIDLKKPPYGAVWIQEVTLVKPDMVTYVCEARTPKREQTVFVPGTIMWIYVEFAGQHTDEIAACMPDNVAANATAAHGPNPTLPIGVVPQLDRETDLVKLAMWFAKDMMVARIVRGLCDGTPMDMTQMFSDADIIHERMRQMKEELPYV